LAALTKVGTRKMSRVRRVVVRAPLIARAAAQREAVRAFLAGESNGEVLLHGLYDHVLEEPVPEELARLLGDPDPDE
jgi:hypothetical protein